MSDPAGDTRVAGDPGLVAETERLRIRRLAAPDAPFILALLNDPDFLRYIGDRGVRTVDDAAAYIEDGPVASYRAHGVGLCLVLERATGSPAGICGVLRRPTLEDPDLGFAFLPDYRGRGYALEAAGAVMRHAAGLGIERLAAIVSPGNEASARLLAKLGFRFEGLVRLTPEAHELELYGADLTGSAAR